MLHNISYKIVFVFCITVSNSLAWAREVVDERERARIAAEGIRIGAPRGAGGDPLTSVAQPDVSARPSAPTTTSIQDALTPYGDALGLRSFLKSEGVEYSLTYIGEALGNVSGGSRRGGTYSGRLDFQFDADLAKIASWDGANFHSNVYQIHGAGLSHKFVSNLLTVSSIEALPASRLYELWLEQKIFDRKIAIKVGQIAADTEFGITQTGTLFINSTFGWPNIMSAALPSGGPAYPLATPGVRVKYVPNSQLSLQAGAFNGDPAGRTATYLDPQRRNRTGTSFRFNDPAFMIAEVAYAYNIATEDVGEPGTVTLGGWYHFDRFDSLRSDKAGISLANPSASGVAQRLRGNSGLYGMVDQTIYREPDDPNDGASIFARLFSSPGDRNLIDLYVDAGIAYKGLLSGRSDDTLGLSVARSRFSPGARGLDRDGFIFANRVGPQRKSEMVLEATYQAVIGPGITVQPTLQYVLRPSGGIANPRDASGARIKDAAVLGLRATIRY